MKTLDFKGNGLRSISRQWLRYPFFILVAASLGVGANDVAAQDGRSVADGDYNSGTTWDLGFVPNSVNSTAYVENGKTVSISADIPAIDLILVGAEGSAGTVNHSAGLVDLTSGATDQRLLVGQDSPGDYNMTGGTISTGGDLAVGDAGVGTFVQSGVSTVNIGNSFFVSALAGSGGSSYTQNDGDINVNAWTLIGNQGGSDGTYNLNDGNFSTTGRLIAGSEIASTGQLNVAGGLLSVGEDLRVGVAGAGTVVQSGSSTVNIQNSLIVSVLNTSAGSSYTQAGGDVNVGLNGGGWMVVGDSSGSNGTYNLNGGNLNPMQALVVADKADSAGQLNVAGGTLTTGGDLRIGESGVGAASQSGTTTVNIGNSFFVSNNATSDGSSYTQDGGDVTVGAWMLVGNQGGSNGTYHMNGGSVTVNGRLILGAESDGNGSSEGTFNLTGGTVNVPGNGVGQEGALVVGRNGAGEMNQSGGSITAEYVDIAGDPGTTDTNGGTYTMTGGSLTTTSEVGIRVGLNADSGSVPSSFSVENATINSAGDLEVGRDSNASFLTFGSNVTAAFAGDLSTSTGTATGTLGWGSDAAGVSALEIAGDVDVSDGVLQAVFITFSGIPTSEITAPHDLLLVDNQGDSWVDGLLNFDQDLDAVGDQLLEQGEELIDPLGVLGASTYYVSYYGLNGLGNDIYLTLAPVFAADNADFDADGDVDGDDLLILQLGLGVGNSRPQGDANADGVVNAADLGVWQAQYGSSPGTPASAASSAVPEPTSLVLLLGPTALLLLIRRWR